MPTYTFLCNECGPFEDFKTLKDYTGKCKCPTCKKVSKQRVYEEDIPNGFVKLADCEITNLGHLAHRNTEKMTSDEKAALTRKHNEYKQGPVGDLPAGMTRLKNADGTIDTEKLKVKNGSKRTLGKPK